MPVLIEKIGDEGYGIMLLASGILGNLTFLDLGFSKGIMRYIAEYKSKNNYQRIAKIIATSFQLYLGIGLAVSIIILALIFSGFVNIFNIQDENSSIFINVLFVAAGLSVVSWPIKVFDSALKGLNKYHENNKALLVGSILSPLFTLAATFFETSIESLFFIQNFALVIPGLVQYIMIKKVLGKFKFIAFDKTVLNEIGAVSIWSFFNQMASVLLYQADRILIGIFLPVSSLTIYKIVTLPYNYVGVITGLTSSAILPKIIGDFVKEGKQTLDKYYYLGSRYSNYISSFLALATALFAYPFIKIWVGNDYLPFVWIAQIACLFQLVWKSNLFLGKVFFGQGKIMELSIIAIFVAIINIPISIYLIPYFGVGGVVFGTLLAGSLSIILQYIFVFPRFGIRLKDYLKEVFLKGQTINILVAIVIFIFFENSINKIQELWHLIFSLSLFTIFSILIFYRFIISRDHRHKLKNLLKSNE